MFRRSFLTRSLATIALSTVFVAGPLAAGTHGLSLSGDYIVNGIGMDGLAYQGKVKITEIGTKIALHWEIGNDLFSGTGELDGRILTVNWGDQHPVIYVVMPNGNLHGTWGDGRALEKLTLQP